jgi:hypothetical protein
MSKHPSNRRERRRSAIIRDLHSPKYRQSIMDGTGSTLTKSRRLTRRELLDEIEEAEEHEDSHYILRELRRHDREFLADYEGPD